MSEIFEGIIIGQITSAVDQLPSSSSLAIAHLEDVTIIYRSDSRAKASFSEELDGIAANLSREFGRTVLVRYDSRLGVRSADVYSGGGIAVRFAAEDELFVRLDENGDSLKDEKPVLFDERQSDEEYETLTNAIELGLKAIGERVSWLALRRFIASQ